MENRENEKCESFQNQKGHKEFFKQITVKAFGFFPQNFLSCLTGALVRVHWPRPLRQLIHSAFVQLFRIDMDLAEFPLESYQTIEEIFTRRLVPGSRTLDGSWVSPSDGYLIRSEKTANGEAIQAKGLTFKTEELVGEVQKGHEYAWYQTVYLAPHNYHRVHAPCSGQLKSIRHIPGRLWPVNSPFVSRIPKLFTQNERLVFGIEPSSGGKIWLVMVGAFNVGRMVSPLAPFLVTNGETISRDPGERVAQYDQSIKLGDELGTFMLGSTVIVVLDPEALSGLGGEAAMLTVSDKIQVQMGQRLIRGTHD